MWRPSLALAALVGLTVLVTAPGVADASTASVGPFTRAIVVPLGEPQQVVYDAAPGEINAAVITSQATPGGGLWTITDSGAVITPGAGCNALDAHTVRCASVASSAGLVGVVIAADVRLGDRNDTLEFQPPDPFGGWLVFANGGPGNDHMIGSPAGGELDGGPGDDALHSPTTFTREAILDAGPGDDQVFGGIGPEDIRGGGGRDELHGGGGRDTLTDGDSDSATGDGGPGPDILDGGRSRDLISYSQRTRPLSIDLQRGVDQGEQGEGDTLISIASVIGGRASDRLSGTRGINRLDGGGGRNRLFGRRGSDSLHSASGPVSCGPGQDLVDAPGARTYLEPSCEHIAADLHEVSTQMSAYPDERRARWLGYFFSCLRDPDEGNIYPCSGNMIVREAGGRHRKLAHGQTGSGAWQFKLLRARLLTIGQRLASRPNGVLATIRFTGYSTIRWTIRLKTPR